MHHLQRALAGNRLVGVDRARVLMTRGLLGLQLGTLRKAEADFEASAIDFAAADMAVESAQALHNSGYIHMLAGDLVGALQRMDKARPVLAPLSAIFRAVCDQDRAEVLVAAGLHHEARGTIAEVATAYGRLGSSQNQGQAEFLLARLLLLDDPRKARVVARRAARRFRRRGSDAWADRAEVVEFAADVDSGRHTAQLLGQATEIASRLRDNGLRNDLRQVQLQAVRVQLRRKEYDDARASLSAIRIGPQAPIATRLLNREVRAELEVARGHTGRAMQHVRSGLGDLHSWQSSFGSLDLQSSLVGHGRRLAFQGLRLALADGQPRAVFEWSERARALSSRVLPIRPPASSAAAEDLAELRRLRGQDSGMTNRPLTARERELRARIRQRAWDPEGSGVVTEPVQLDELHDALGFDTTLVAHLSTGDGLHVLVVGGGRSMVLPLGPLEPGRELMAGLQADLDMAATEQPPPLARAVRSALAARLAALDEVLLAPIRDRLGSGRIVLTPAGALAGVPWPMLPSLVGRPLTQPLSATRWIAQGRETPLRTAGFAAGPDVPRAAEEVQRSAPSWGSAGVLLAPESTAAAVSELASSVDVLHVSAHGRHAVDNPLFSGLRLSDGTWFGYDIDQLQDIPELVILSACELGRSTVRWGEELIGMTTAWLHAGARCVIAAPAAVSDDEACDLLPRVHRLLAEGMPPADALAQASGDGSLFQCFGAGW
jgi:tetratricopeptide (TPR) repeat protein